MATGAEPRRIAFRLDWDFRRQFNLGLIAVLTSDIPNAWVANVVCLMFSSPCRLFLWVFVLIVPGKSQIRAIELFCLTAVPHVTGDVA